MDNGFIEELAAIVDAEGLLLGDAEQAPFLEEKRGLYHGHCVAVVRPATTAEVAAVVECCNKYNQPITPQSGNTGLCGGAVPDGGILLNLGRMNRVRELDRVGGTMTVEAGCILKTLQQVASAEGLLFTLSSPSEKDCQLGGNLSTNLGGINVLRYGTAREQVLGLEVVLPSGEIWNGLRALRKDNAGYDLKQLFIGAEGTLGIITAATVKLFSAPQVQVTGMVAVPDIYVMMETFTHIRQRFNDHLSGFEIIPRFAVDMVLEYDSAIKDPFPQRHGWYGLVELNATDPEMDLKTSLRQLFDSLPYPTRIAQDQEESEQLWAVRRAINAAQKVRGASIKHDISVPLNDIAEFMTQATRMVEAQIPGVQVCGFGHAGDGNVHFNLTQPPGADPQEFLDRWEEMNRMIHDLVRCFGGSIAAEHGVGQLRRAELRRTKDPVEYAMMQAIKGCLDPNNLLNPGKVVDPNSSPCG